MPRGLELTGSQFGRLVAVGRSHQDKHRAWVWACRCDCGRAVLVRGSTLMAGNTRACASCATTESSTTHGGTGTPLYLRWRAMLSRTEYPKNRHYRNYGGRGIEVCSDWHDFEAFERDMGPTFSPELELDRINNNGHYEPSNCRWATRIQQQRNRRTNHPVTWRGRTLTIQEWGETLGIKPNTIVHRLRRGWALDRALSKGVSRHVLLQLANS